MAELSSKLLEQAVGQFAKLPGIGRRTALRLCLHLLKSEKDESRQLSDAIVRLAEEIQYCQHCHNISDTDISQICADPRREKDILCVVEDVRDVMAVENTSQFRGKYHVLGGIISPIEGIGPNDLSIASLVERVESGTVHEVIMALPATIEGDTTNYYIYKKIKHVDLLITTIARGVAVGDDLEFADEITLGRSILNRTPFETILYR
ncbi:MAG: recombination mediator RecR [Bacteroidales bacterium]|nr:recombination mediator RecR [Bacteroidales bacterium]